MTQDVQTYLDANKDAFFEEFMEILRMPSVSTDPAHREDVARTAEWVASRMRRAGIPDVEVVSTAWHPIVVGKWHVSDDKPTLLIYGHYDVQPEDPVDLWQSPPFEPTIRDGKIYARGAADMKGNLVASIQAVEALAHAHSQPPLNITFVYEGEEEVGSSSLKTFLAEQADRVPCDVIMSADSGFPAPGVPGFFVGRRGGCGGQIDIKTATTDLHSGLYGATVLNATQVMSKLAASFHTDDGRVAIAGFYDAVPELTQDERDDIAYTAANMQEVKEESGAFGYWGEPGYLPYERIGARPTLDINRIWGGFMGAGSKTVTPNEAHLKLTCRLVPNQEPEKILDLIHAHVASHVPAEAEVTITDRTSFSKPYATPRDNWALQRAASVMSDLYGLSPIFFRVGGSVPITSVFKEHLGADTVSLGFSQPGSQPHAPNEWYRVEDLPMAQRGYAAVIEALGEEA